MFQKYLYPGASIAIACAGLATGVAAQDRQAKVVTDASWSSTIARGLEVYEARSGSASVQLVCDPDQIFGETPNGSFSVVLPNETSPTRVVILSSTGAQAAFDLDGNRASQAKSDPAQWDRLIDILSTVREFAVVSARASATFEVEAPLVGACR